MKIPLQAAATAAITLFATHAAHAQGAVQWKVSDGGNGHWYRMLITASPTRWEQAKLLAESIGGHLATIRSSGENAVSLAVAEGGPVLPGGSVWLGGIQPTGESSDYAWVTGEPFDWTPGCGFSNTDSGCGFEDRLTLTSPWTGCPWNDVAACWFIPALLVEWSADCNNDGVVDYGQCRDGSLPDYNDNNIPDCCESGSPCLVGNYPVQWRVEDGGNGHWYVLHPTTESWPALRMISEGLGGHLVTLNTIHEWSWVKQKFEIPFQTGRFVGGFQDRNATDFVEPGGGWRWITGEPFTFDNTYMAPFDDFCGNQQVMYFYGCCNQFLSDIQNGIEPGCDSYLRQAIFEWSADCNGDGIVDYGQILQGQLADTNADGVPDICQGPTCADADIYRDFNVNGADLGILLSQWGPNTPLTESDLNDDGVVNGADLGLLLSFWGACP